MTQSMHKGFKLVLVEQIKCKKDTASAEIGAGQGREVTNLLQQACIKKAKYFREKRREMSDEKQ